MSGEYYRNEDPVTKYHKEYDHISPKSVSNKENYKVKESKSQDLRLHDIEEQLEMAEDRCNTLKDQLDYMKQIYGVNNTNLKSRKISNIAQSKKSDDKISGSSLIDETNEREAKIAYEAYDMKRQNSNAIGTDSSGAAVRTINNILNGITDSVNRLSELHSQISESPRSRKLRSASGSPHPVMDMKLRPHSNTDIIIDANKMYAHKSVVIQDIIMDNPPEICDKSRGIKKKCREVKILNKKPIASQQSIRKGTKIEKRNRNYSTKTSCVEKNTNMKRKFFNSFKPNAQTHKLVEIYHNIAAKNSDSDEGNLKSKTKRRPVPPRPKNYTENKQSSKLFLSAVPPIRLPEGEDEDILQEDDEENAPPVQFEIVPAIEATDDDYELPQAPRTEISCYSKNYELPTIASRMKQVAKSYLNSFTFKAIPFCAAISTTPSHNIGINIQQVMNIIKTRQPINGISPTLAHNISLAAERLNSRPLSALVSTIHSKAGISQCPLSRTVFNYPQLQEMARGIPEETPEEIEEAVDSPTVQTVIITGPSGDMEVKNRNLPIWAANTSQSDQCTCVPQSGIEIQQIVNKVKKNMLPMTAKSIGSQVDNRMSRYNNLNRRKSMPKRPPQVIHSRNGYASANVATNNQYTITTATQNCADVNPLQGREKNLKEVLTNLHNEFEDLNRRYEGLSQKAGSDDEDTLRELEKMETELSKKEEEITMVMTLYKEVIALKQQVKSLKERASQASVNVNNQDQPKFKEYNNPQAAFHLTKLLRQIQHYQMTYKKDFSAV